MKNLFTISTLVSPLMFSPISFAEWTKTVANKNGDVFYLDLERIRKVDGYVYYWTLGDLLKPTDFGDLSVKTYRQGDCKKFRVKSLSYSFYKEPMGEGRGEVLSEPMNWVYPTPDSADEIWLETVCNQ